MDNNLELQIAKLIWPEIDIENVRIIAAMEGVNTFKALYPDRPTFDVETIPIIKYAVFVRMGYGSQSKTLVIQKTRIQECDPIASWL
jgi:hypothetical protein